ncbi:SAM-dependent methyltransferase [Actinoalloteichus hoggarensis]|uniref:Cypemycin methyltransferase n=1 Tax=Actinoalloteichus hoggarensis TaxID=1470176 RepID=A0A221W7R2_9PSEU|nr:class I SAM-dependent methyltransferase [Actinoalloteichus hoggarensis]ASO21676.1 Cypemycin methyltransferase [Actinoalloteichus hoggarensis]MBB5922270.1 SAM-dependent methyltransferase [Actinoalloteichus hoggarensis]
MKDQRFWDDLYGSREQLFSGNPNGVLVAEASGLPVGRALDVGCGEGGDARWLVERGWRVTAVDISQVALDRAARAVGDDDVRWVRADLTTTPLESGAYDLVSLQYFPLVRDERHAALRGLLAAVAPGGTLLVGAHDLGDLGEHRAGEGHGDGVESGAEQPDFDVDSIYQPHEIADLLDDGWEILVQETRLRTAPAPEGTRHVHDVVLRARRLPAA